MWMCKWDIEGPEWMPAMRVDVRSRGGGIAGIVGSEGEVEECGCVDVGRGLCDAEREVSVSTASTARSYA